MLLAWPRA